MANVIDYFSDRNMQSSMGLDWLLGEEKTGVCTGLLHQLFILDRLCFH